MICANCLALGRDAHRHSRVISRAELTPAFVEDVREYVIGIRDAGYRGASVNFRTFIDLVFEIYRDLTNFVVEKDGHEVLLGTNCLLDESIDYWVRDYLFTRRPDGVTTRLKDETVERLVVITSILKAADPHAAMLWGVRVANDAGSAPSQVLVQAKGSRQYSGSGLAGDPANDNHRQQQQLP